MRERPPAPTAATRSLFRSRTPFALRTHRAGFADEVIELDGTDSNISRDVTLSIGALSDTLVVTASRGPESRTSVTQSLSVVSRPDVQALGSTELSDVLRFVPGTSVEGTGREGGGPTSLFVRGGDSDYNVVLIDGVRANLDGGRFDFSRIAAGEIERVEVLRGAQSALWGADAMTSVVQIITKRANPTSAPEVSGSVEGGSFSTFRGDAGVYGGTGTKVDYRAAITSRKTDGAFSDLLPEDDRYTQTAFDGGIGIAIGSSASARGGLRYSDGNGKVVGPVNYGARDTRHGVSNPRPDGLRHDLAHARIAVRWKRQRQLLPLSRAVRGHHRRPVLHVCDPDRHAERALSERHPTGPPHRCRGVRCAGSGWCAARRLDSSWPLRGALISSRIRRQK